MIRRVRRQFICITMSMLTAVLLVPLVALNVITDAMSYNQTKNLLEQIAISEAEAMSQQHFPEDPNMHGIPPEKLPAQTTAISETTTTSTSVTTTITTTVTKAASTTTSSPKTTKAAATASVSRETKTAATTPVPKTTKPAVTSNVSRETKAPIIETAPWQPEPEHPDPDKPYPDEPWDDHWHLPDDPWYNDWHMPEDAAILTPQLLNFMANWESNTHPIDFKKKNEEPPAPRNQPVSIDSFICYANAEGMLWEINGSTDYTNEEGQAMVDYVLESEKTDGWYGNLQFFQKTVPNGTLVVFSDRSADRLLLKKLLTVSVLVFLFMEVVVFLLTMVLTKRAMRPMQESFEQQRQFISDAGHELKTPLTIILANTEILQEEIGKNKWLDYIHSQTERMRILISDMMNLSKLDLGNPGKEFSEFSLSNAVNTAVLPFESQTFEQHKTLKLEIQEQINYIGNAEQIKQLVAIFIDNAIKYSDEQGIIRVTLEQQRDKKLLKIYNTGKGITEAEKEKIFQRFYRSDASRARATGGYGLGLSIAQSIANAHKIKIQVESEYEHWICFTLFF